MAANYNPFLVILSILIATAASYTALTLAGRVASSTGRHRLHWLAGGAICLGTGIWCMHFVGMLAYQPHIRLGYDVLTVVVSLLVAMGASALALFVASRSTLHLKALCLGGVCTGLAIASMHYIGMRAVRVSVPIHYDGALVAASLAIAIVAATAALWLAFSLRDEQASARYWQRVAASPVMGGAIAGMHYTGMAAIHLGRTSGLADAPVTGFPPSDLALAISIPCLFMLGGAVLLAFVDNQINTRRRIELALSESEDHYRVLFEETPRPICLVDAATGHFLAVNRAAVGQYGYSREEFLAMSLDRLAIPSGPEDRGPGPDSAEPPVVRHRRRDGTERTVEMSRRSLEFQGRAAEMIIITDITERERADEALQVSRQQLDAMINNIPDMVWLKDTELRYLDLNEATLRSAGLRRDQVIGRTDFDLWPRELAERYIAQDRVALRTGARQTVEEAIPSKTGGLAWVETISTPFVDRHGRPAGVAGIARDLTERRELERQLLQSQKLEAIGSLAAGVAHEINTPTQYVGDLRFLETAYRDLAALIALYDGELAGLGGAAHDRAQAAAQSADLEFLQTEIPRALQQSLEGISQVAAIVGAVKGFSHPGHRDKTLVDLNRAIENTVTVSRNEWKYVADLITLPDPELPLVPCHPGEIQQVLLNLIVNAAHAIGERPADSGQKRGRIEVATSRLPGWVEVRVSDTGTGIPESARAKVFDPFFTTKGVGRGTGQGLAISHSVVVDKHGGTISFETELGKGTTFVIRLPLEAHVAQAAEAA